jgi:hypothetical protein
MQQLDPVIVIAACPKFFNPSIGRKRRFTSAVILLDDIVEILARADRDKPQLSSSARSSRTGWEACYPSSVIVRRTRP